MSVLMVAAPSPPILPVLQLGEEQAFSEEEIVYLAVRYLAGKCDGASKRDDQGFNRVHASFCHDLAELPFSRWTDRQLWAARKALKTYERTQLAEIGLTPYLPDIPEPVRVVPRYDQVERRTVMVEMAPERGRHLKVVEWKGQQALELVHDFNPDLVYEVKALPTRDYDPANQRWLVPMSLEVLEPLADLIARWGYEVPEDAIALIDSTIATFRTRMDLSSQSESDFHVENFGGKKLQPFPFQRAGIAYMTHVLDSGEGVLNADEMGLGKTIQGMGAFAHYRNQKPGAKLLVVCPASLKRNWEREIARWFNSELDTYVVTDGKVFPISQMLGFFYDVVIIGYNSIVLKKWLDELIAWGPDVVICDEAHKLKNEDANQTKLVDRLLNLIPNSVEVGRHQWETWRKENNVPVEAMPKVIFQTGTPVVNRPGELYTLLRLMRQQANFGTYRDFMDTYGYASTRQLERLNDRLRQFCMVRRLKKDVWREMPEKLRSTAYLELTSEAEDRYWDAAANLAHFIANKKIESVNWEKEVRREYEQATLGLEEGEEIEDFQTYFNRASRDKYGAAFAIAREHEQLLRWEALKGLVCDLKTPQAIEWIEEFLDDSDQKLIVFVWHKRMGQAIADRFGCDFISGEVDPDKRLPMVDRFQTDPSRRIIVGNIQAMGEGLTLTASSNVVFLEFGWNPKDQQQAEDRAHRIGQEAETVNIYSLVAEGTIEEEIVEIIAKKLEIVTAIQDGVGADLQREMMAELEARLSKKLAARR